MLFRSDNEDLRTPEKDGPPDAPRGDKGRRVGLDGTRVVDVREPVPGLPRGTGVRIQRAAALSHLESGDIVSRFGDQIVCTAGQLEKLMRIHSTDTVTIRFIRDGRERTATVDFGRESPPQLRPGDFSWSLQDTWISGNGSLASGGTITARGVERIESVVIGSKTVEVRMVGKDLRYLIRDGNGRAVGGGPLRFPAEWHSVPKEDRKSTRLNSSHVSESRMPSAA